MGISISVTAGINKSSSSVNASGSMRHLITNDERTTFRLADKQLKDAVKASFGKSPNDAWLRSRKIAVHAKGYDLYKKYNWPQVQMVLVVQSAEILKITQHTEIVKTQEFANNSRQTGTFNVGISESVNNTTSSNWSTDGTLSIGQKFTYGVSFPGGGGATGETSLSYSQSWGVGGQESKSITVGFTSGVTVDLKPGEAVVANLSTIRSVMKVRIRYKAYLIGSTAVNYNPTYKGHHFWGLGIGHVMSAAKIPNSVRSTEEIEISYYSNSKVELTDPKTKALKTTFALAAVPGH